MVEVPCPQCSVQLVSIILVVTQKGTSSVTRMTERDFQLFSFGVPSPPGHETRRVSSGRRDAYGACLHNVSLRLWPRFYFLPSIPQGHFWVQVGTVAL